MQRILKIILCGEGGVGKTSFLNAFQEGKYKENISMTVGPQPRTLHFERKNKEKLSFQIWDLGGQQHFAGIEGLYQEFCRGAKSAIVCFDMGEPDTIEKLPEWLKKLPEGIPKILVGTKEDTAKDIKDIVESILMAFGFHFHFDCYLEVSAKENLSSIGEIFKKLLIQTCQIDEEESEQIIQDHFQSFNLQFTKDELKIAEQELEPIEQESCLTKQEVKNTAQEMENIAFDSEYSK
ncbi:MAG: Rab family GTPase [Candidatus Hodarchaeota archaeon]